MKLFIFPTNGLGTGKKVFLLLFLIIISISIFTFSKSVAADELKENEARMVVEKAFDYWRGMSSVAKFSMTIHRSDFQREMVMRGWTKGRDAALFFVEAPAKDYGNGSLKKGREMWSYNPKINRTIKIPPSMMSQSWMGSDFSNDDLAKSDSVIKDYHHSLLKKDKRDGMDVYTIESIADENAPVVWSKQILVIREDGILLLQSFYDEEMILVKEMVAEEIEMIGGRLFPRIWTMRRKDEVDRYTRMEYFELSFDDDLDDRIFTLNSLKTRRR